jgi:hypothetical protein
MLRFLYASAALVLTVGCVGPTSSPDWLSLMRVDSQRWGEYAGKTVLIDGTAENCKMAAAVVMADGSAVYLDELDHWPEGLHKKEVTVTGILIYHPKREPAEDGRLEQLPTGPYYSLASAKWNEVK